MGNDPRPTVTIVVVSYNMARELPRTLRSLAPEYQRGIAPSAYEVVLVDNGSDRPVDEQVLGTFAGQLRHVRIDPAPPSPARAANVGLEMARGDLVGLLIDGARLASPGLLANALVAARTAERAVVATLAWHLGSVPHMQAAEAGYDREAEDRLLADTGWEDDGYRLFDISTLAGSSAHGWFGPLDESNAMFMPRAMWDELGGLDERFVLPGGGALNHDLYRRACELADARQVLLLGEGTFHQMHGGSLTSRTYPRERALEEYQALRGSPLGPPPFDPIYVGTVPPQSLPHLERSVRWALNARHRAPAVGDVQIKPSSSDTRPG